MDEASSDPGPGHSCSWQTRPGTSASAATGSRDGSDFSDDERHECPRILQERLNALHHQGNMMLLVIREHICEHAPAYAADLEHAILCYNMVKVHLDDYFATVGSYVLQLGGPAGAQVVAGHHTLEYYVSIDNLRQVFRHLQWSNMLFNWKLASDLT
ncbi:hypothetical protein V5799_032756 [Amblyomma americanum]|uniref:Uncharacterized protein n=1 Tax=Amblyomma americanum TaxID=6943 RepID=A0AAQ4DQA1_AMBAM